MQKAPCSTTFQSNTDTKVQRIASLREEKLSKQSRQLKCDAIFLGGGILACWTCWWWVNFLKKGSSLHLFAHFKINLDPEIFQFISGRWKGCIQLY